MGEVAERLCAELALHGVGAAVLRGGVGAVEAVAVSVGWRLLVWVEPGPGGGWVYVWSTGRVNPVTGRGVRTWCAWPQVGVAARRVAVRYREVTACAGDAGLVGGEPGAVVGLPRGFGGGVAGSYGVLPWTARDVELRWGFSLRQVNRLVVFGVKWAVRYQRHDFGYRAEIAWFAMVEHLYAAATPLRVAELINVAWRAVSRQLRQDERHCGTSMNDPYAGPAAGFERYWRGVTASGPGVEEAVVERAALGQIVKRLSGWQRATLDVLAAHGNDHAAAAALGTTLGGFHTRLYKARRAFLALWHQGETPLRRWGLDRRRPSGPTDAASALTALRARQARRAPADRPRPRGRGRGKIEWTISNEELERRYRQGETMQQLALSLGVGRSSIHRRLQEAGVPRRPGGPWNRKQPPPHTADTPGDRPQATTPATTPPHPAEEAGEQAERT